MLNAFTGSPWLFGAAIVLCILLPFAVSAVLDGIVHVVRGHGFIHLIISVTAAAVLVFSGALMWNAGIYDPNVAGGADIDDLESHLAALLWVSVPLSVIGFMLRQVARLRRAKRA